LQLINKTKLIVFDDSLYLDIRTHHMYYIPSHRRLYRIHSRQLGHRHLYLLIPVRFSQPFRPQLFSSPALVFFANQFLCRDIPLVALFFVVWKLWKKTRWIPLEEVKIREALLEIEQMPEEQIPPAKGWRRLNILW